MSRKEHAGIRALTCDLGTKDTVLPQPFLMVLGKLFIIPPQLKYPCIKQIPIIGTGFISCIRYHEMLKIVIIKDILMLSLGEL